MRGKQLLKQLHPSAPAPEQNGKGRSSRLLQLRDKCLLARYFYYSHFKKRRFEEILQAIVDEFFLSHERIVDIIAANVQDITQLKEQQTTLTQLKHQWPQFKW